MSELLLVNPRKRRAAAKRKTAKRRVRRAAPRRSPVVVMANPSPRRRRSRLSTLRTKVRSVRRKYKRNPFPSLSTSGIAAMAKGAALGAVGAIAVDVVFGQVQSYLPASMQSPVDATGALNPLYFVAKGAAAVVLGKLGAKVTKHATTMAEGSLTVSAYEALRSFVPSSLTLGYVAPAMQVGRRPAAARPAMGQYLSGYKAPVNNKYMGEYVS